MNLLKIIAHFWSFMDKKIQSFQKFPISFKSMNFWESIDKNQKKVLKKLYSQYFIVFRQKLIKVNPLFFGTEEVLISQVNYATYDI
jgi:hypothetical protein